MSEYKQCPNGHYYQGDHCPYCSDKHCITVGQSTDNDIVIIDPHVNEIHCRIEKIGEECFRITDLQSKNGTYVNDKRVTGSMEIGPYDEVRVGNSRVVWIHQFASDALPTRFDHLSGIIEPDEDYTAKKTQEGNPHIDEPRWEYHQCSNGHYYEGDSCPYCQKENLSITEAAILSNQESVKRMTTIPMCRRCGQPLRKSIPNPPHGVVVSSLNDIQDHVVPWNYQWNVQCEHCGHDYNLKVGLHMGSHGIDNRSKHTTLKVSSRGYCHDFECCIDDFNPSTQLSGVEIHTETDSQAEMIFLSANELKYIVNALKDSPVIQQFDYQEESSEINSRRT